MKKRIYIYPLIMLMALPAICISQTISLSLKQAQQMAIDSSYATVDARYNTAKKRQEVKDVLATGLPQINATAELQNFLDIPVSLVPAEFFGGEAGQFAEVQFGTKYNLTAGVSASQLIFDGTYIIGLKASKTVVQLALNQERKTEQEIRVQVADAYITVLLAEANLAILSESISTLNKTLSDTRALYENGLTEEQDVDQLQLNLNNIEINYDRSTQFLDISKKTLNFLLGLDLSERVSLTDNIDNLVQFNGDEAYVDREPNLANHPDLLLAKSNLEIQSLTIQGQKAAYYPNLSAFFSHRQVGQRNEFNFTDTEQPWFPTTIVGATLNVPIFSGFRRNAKVQQAKIGFEQGRRQLQQTEENLKLQIVRARSNYSNALKTYDNQKESFALAERISNKTNIKYAEGLASSFDLNVAETQKLTEQGKYIQATNDLLLAKQQLDKALNIY